MRVGILILVFGLMASLWAQESPKIKWKRQIPRTELPVLLFHSTQVANLPTTETIQKGDFEFEISHRFVPLLKDGFDVLYGLDGPVNMRIALTYGITNRLNVTLGRSNLEKNMDVQLKYKLLEFRHSVFPAVLAVRAGGAWNRVKFINRDYTDSRNFQYYIQGILNGMYKKKLGIGVIPSYLQNSHIYCPDEQHTFSIGSYLQFYFAKTYSVFVEWTPTVTGWRDQYNPVSLGIELETGGHFFKILVTNTTRLNPSQYLAGALQKFNDGDLHLAFNITRYLSFKKH